MKIGRNDLCHCGSGQKYKKCCAAKDDAARSAQLAAQTLVAPAEGSQSVPETSTQGKKASSSKAAAGKVNPAKAPVKQPKGPPPPGPAKIKKHAI